MKPGNAQLEDRTEGDARGVADQVAPEEAEAQDEAAQRRPADCVDPGGVIELTDLNQRGKSECHGRDPPSSDPGKNQTEEQKQGERPECITGEAGQNLRQVTGEAAGADAQSNGEGQQDRRGHGVTMNCSHDPHRGHWRGELRAEW